MNLCSTVGIPGHMVDAHCHLDRYPDPAAVATKAATYGVGIIAVTGLPSHFAAGQFPAQRLPNVRLALGLHPLLARDHQPELSLFKRLLPQTSYVGEVGLDRSRDGSSTYEAQIGSFRFVLECLRANPKVVSIHSRRAEQDVLSLLDEYEVGPAIFHWYSGSLKVAKLAAERGHFFSVNPAMIAAETGNRLLRGLPRENILTETDGPYVRVGTRHAVPWDIFEVATQLEKMWNASAETVCAQIRRNVRAATAALRPPLG